MHGSLAHGTRLRTYVSPQFRLVRMLNAIAGQYHDRRCAIRMADGVFQLFESLAQEREGGEQHEESLETERPAPLHCEALRSLLRSSSRKTGPASSILRSASAELCFCLCSAQPAEVEAWLLNQRRRTPHRRCSSLSLPHHQAQKPRFRSWLSSRLYAPLR